MCCFLVCLDLCSHLSPSARPSLLLLLLKLFTMLVFCVGDLKLELGGKVVEKMDIPKTMMFR